jgi:hypothetical protein
MQRTLAASFIWLNGFVLPSAQATPNVVISLSDGEIAIMDKYRSLGGSAGWLGPSTGPIYTAPDGVGQYQWYWYGGIYWSPSTGAHEIHGAICDRWAELGWETGLGYPKTDETSIRTILGRTSYEVARRSDFQWGVISWTPTYGAHEVYGAILGQWTTYGRETGSLGAPVTGEEDLPGYPGDRWNKFDNNYLHWSASTGVVQTGAVPHQPANPPQSGRPGGTYAGKWTHVQGHPLVIQWAMSPIADANYGAIIRESFLAWKRTGTLVFFKEVAYPTRFPANFSGILVDLEQVDPGEAGVTRHSPSADQIFYQAHVYLNKPAFDGMTAFDRQKAAVHEIGHALGLDHPDFSVSQPTIMAQGKLDFNVPQPYDVLLINLRYPF